MPKISFPGANQTELAHYWDDHGNRLTAMAAIVKQHTPPKGLVLDVGAKPFFLSQLLIDQGYSYTGIGVSGKEKDLRTDQISACSTGPTENQKFSIALTSDTGTTEIPLYEVNIELNTWPFKNQTFDTLVWTETLEHLTCDPAFAWQQANRTLKTGGTLLFSVPNALYWVRAVQLLAGKNIDDPYSWHGPFGRHNRLYTIKEITTLAKLHGFEVDQISSCNFPEQTMSTKKKMVTTIAHTMGKLSGQRQGKTIVAILKKTTEAHTVQRPGFLYH